MRAVTQKANSSGLLMDDLKAIYSLKTFILRLAKIQNDANVSVPNPEYSDFGSLFAVLAFGISFIKE